MLRVIQIENIKGIQNKRFELNILPNKPSLLVAPNGFGKSSFATAFNSMNNNRIILNEDDYFSENDTLLPRINLAYVRPDNSVANLEATNATNTISGELDYFVINNLTKPKGNASNFGGFANAKASLIIEDIVLVDRIPENVPFSYAYRQFQLRFGVNSKVLPNLENVLSNFLLVERLSEKYQELQRAHGARIQGRINAIIDQVRAQAGTTQEIINWIAANRLNDLKQIQYLSEIADLIEQFDIGYDSETKNYLAALQLIWLYNDNSAVFRQACIFNNYRLDKQRFEETLGTFNATWKAIRASETQGKLIVKFPKANQISNGQRDILTFISMLFKAKRKLNKHANILIIDEVFDYLDDANLTAAQYYVSNLIKEYADLNKRIYPLILTHLNPNYFKNYAFSNQKVYYLDTSVAVVNPQIIRLLRNRDNAAIKMDVDKYLLHYDPGTINKRVEFRGLLLPELWGEGANFIQHVNSEVTNYLANRNYDPFAVCAALRVKIEHIAYNKIQGAQAQIDFLATHKTRSKLEKAEELGVISPESHYLLGIIYNEGMHWKENQDNISPVASKLENLTIKKLIQDIFGG